MGKLKNNEERLLKQCQNCKKHCNIYKPKKSCKDWKWGYTCEKFEYDYGVKSWNYSKKK